MANVEVENSFGFVDKRRSRGETGATALVEDNNYTNVFDLRTRLAAINAGYFTAAQLDRMTKNDMIYALRVASDAAGII